MSLRRFFVETLPDSGEIVINGEDARHLTVVLRARIGEIITVCDGRGLEAKCKLVSLGGRAVIARILTKCESTGESGINFHLYPSVSKGDRFEWMLVKVTELGAASITPVLSARCVAAKPDAKRLERWNKLVREASMQSGRGVIPTIKPPVSFADALTIADGKKIFCYEDEKRLLLSEALRNNIPSIISIMSGPEGGYDHEEAQLATQHGWTLISLGNRLLRCETAPPAALAAILALAGEM